MTPCGYDDCTSLAVTGSAYCDVHRYTTIHGTVEPARLRQGNDGYADWVVLGLERGWLVVRDGRIEVKR